ncbi:MAG: flagellar biosynthesis anti-sigma factor FlgM [Deltaproteobacteria bacterium]|nr:flagellar biosynthesis anti-sigma factor FlgM [Deltaproteobacteria bacterium]MBW2116680.1 flagellar biosynthesis anti-sigma factor FlgM [Deltaproteobacteria bacterium]MBW2342988.1 flagellar biosynthesis anti-sigma factor FlgM [Deltaproteobacteria bacterium]
MKIDDKIISYEINRYIPNSTPSATEKIEEKQLSTEKRAEGKDRSDQDTVVNLSRASKEAQQIKEIISSEPDVREDKVSALRERIESGNYRFDNEAVADKLVDAFIDDIFY